MIGKEQARPTSQTLILFGTVAGQTRRVAVLAHLFLSCNRLPKQAVWTLLHTQVRAGVAEHLCVCAHYLTEGRVFQQDVAALAARARVDAGARAVSAGRSAGQTLSGGYIGVSACGTGSRTSRDE